MKASQFGNRSLTPIYAMQVQGDAILGTNVLISAKGEVAREAEPVICQIKL
jgi:hypothetical protein